MAEKKRKKITVPIDKDTYDSSESSQSSSVSQSRNFSPKLQLF